MQFVAEKFFAFDVSPILDLYLRFFDGFGRNPVFGNELFECRQHFSERIERHIIAHQNVAELPALGQRVRTDRFQIVVYFACFDAPVTGERNKRFYERFFFEEIVVVFAADKADFVTERGQSQVGIVLPEQNPIFGPRGEHAVGFVFVTRSSMSTPM